MNRQKTFNEKLKIVENFIATVNPYEKSPNLNFDLRGYAKYVRDNNLTRKNITTDVMNMFSK